MSHGKRCHTVPCLLRASDHHADGLRSFNSHLLNAKGERGWPVDLQFQGNSPLVLLIIELACETLPWVQRRLFDASITHICHLS